MNLESYKERLKILVEQNVISKQSHDVSLQTFKQLMDMTNRKDIKQAEMLFSHLPMALERIKDGEEFPSPGAEIMQEIEQSSYFHLAEKLVDKIEEKCNTPLPQGEKEYLYMHITNVLNLNLKED